MKWNNDAEEAISRVPFFVRKKVKKRVEEEAVRCRAPEVTMEHVNACRKKFLNQMEKEVRGFQVENCFGPGGCPNRAVISDGLSEQLESELAKRDLFGFLKEKVNGPLKMHHEFRISVSDCPNGCSRPQIVDIGLIGACEPFITDEACSECGACVDVCKEDAPSLYNEFPQIDPSKCLWCGECIKVCPTGTLKENRKGYRVQVGGKLGRHPRLGRELHGIYAPGEIRELLNRCLDHYQQHCEHGERFGEILERTGLKALDKKNEGKYKKLQIG